jgi:hypothetical protein
MKFRKLIYLTGKMPVQHYLPIIRILPVGRQVCNWWDIPRCAGRADVNVWAFVMSMRCLLWIYLLCFSCHATAQVQLIKLDEAENKLGPCEPSIAVNPNNPSEIVAGSVLDNYYYTKNGGKSWKKGKLTSSMGVYGDPCVIADYDNHFYYFHLSDPEGKGWKSEALLDRIVCQRSDNGGKRWNDGAGIGFRDLRHDQDKEWACVNPATNELYVTWTEFDHYNSTEPEDSTYILFSKSSDYGASWSAPLRINQLAGNCLDDDLTVEGAVPSVGPDGQIYVAWAFDEKIYFDRSTDGGETWLEKDKIVARQPGGWKISIRGMERSNGMPVTACDLSDSPHQGTIYINWTDQRHGETDTDIWISKSTDQGETWSEPVRVNDDAPGKQQFLTWMAVDQTTGYLYVVFYDRRHHEDTHTDVYLAYSTDGGETFTNHQLTDEPFEMLEGPFFGDYNHIVAHGGKIYPVWTQMDNLKTSIWTSIVKHEDLEKEEK